MEIIKIDGIAFEVSRCSRPIEFEGRTGATTNLVKKINVKTGNNFNLFSPLNVGQILNLSANGKDYKVRLLEKDELDLTLSFEIVP